MYINLHIITECNLCHQFGADQYISTNILLLFCYVGGCHIDRPLDDMIIAHRKAFLYRGHFLFAHTILHYDSKLMSSSMLPECKSSQLSQRANNYYIFDFKPFHQRLQITQSFSSCLLPKRIPLELDHRSKILSFITHVPPDLSNERCQL